MSDILELPPFPEIISSTVRSVLVACARQFYHAHLQHLRRRAGKSIHLHFGSCVAKGLEVTRRSYWQDGLDEFDSIAAGITGLIHEWGDFEMPPELERRRAGVKDLSGCVDALVSYFENHQLGNDPIRPLMVDGRAMVEKSFCLPLLGTKHPTTGKPIQYAGRFDMLGIHQDAIFVVDEKTALSLGESWRSNWTVRGQITGYCWGAPSILPEGTTIAGGIVRGIGILKQSIAFEQAIVSRPEWQIEQWLRQVTWDVNRAIRSWCEMQFASSHIPQAAWSQALDSACSAYGGCAYLDLCNSPDPRTWYGNYFIEPWNPLAKDIVESP